MNLPKKKKSLTTGGGLALKDDPVYTKYFKMLKMGLPIDVVKHAMTRDGMDGDVLNGDHNKPVGAVENSVALQDDPQYEKYFKMLKLGLPMGAVKNAMERDGEDPTIMDGDHKAPALGKNTIEPNKEVLPRDNFRRTRLHWDTLGKVRSTSVWALVDKDPDVEKIVIDETEFAELFQAKLDPKGISSQIDTNSGKSRNAVKVIEPKRANNGGIILARLKLTYDEMAMAVDKIEESVMSAEQIQGLIEYIPSKDEKQALRKYMTSSGKDSAILFESLCECEKFMVAMMTVKHSKEKIRAMLFKLQFQQCVADLGKETLIVQQSCDELLRSVRLRQLLGIVLNIGNRLNTAGPTRKGKADAFTMKSLLKLNQAKAFDKKTTFLHYVVLVVQRHNEMLSCFKDDLPNVLKADKIYWDQCVSDLEEVENQLENVRKIALHEVYGKRQAPWTKRGKKKSCEDEEMSHESMTLEEEVEALRASTIGLFTLDAIKAVSSLRENVEQTNTKFTKVLEYFGEEECNKMQPHDLFGIIVQFSKDFDLAKEEVAKENKLKKREDIKQKENSQDNIRITITNRQNTGDSPNRQNKEDSEHVQNIKDSPSRHINQTKRHNSPNRMLQSSSMQPNIHAAMKSHRRVASSQPTLTETKIKETLDSRLNRDHKPRDKESTANNEDSKKNAHDSHSYTESRQNSLVEREVQTRQSGNAARQEASDGMKESHFENINRNGTPQYVGPSYNDDEHITHRTSSNEDYILQERLNGLPSSSKSHDIQHAQLSTSTDIMINTTHTNVGSRRENIITPKTDMTNGISPSGQSTRSRARARRHKTMNTRSSTSNKPIDEMKHKQEEVGGKVRSMRPSPESMSQRQRTDTRRKRIARRNGASQSAH